ncbi:MAG: TetR/AcrR family transcriptional regulator [Gammaproteobacteria bacterium]|nr:TetR/AcrR family transcriptional regulator [Gammaproteobacteria bacterium]
MNVIKENTRQTIIDISIKLFAQSGYANVSVRDIAKEVGIKPASLYYHFDNKQTLYLASIKESFSLKASVIAEVLNRQEPAELKLKHYVYKLTELASEDEPFCRLMQREMLDGDEQRLKYLAEKVFQEQFDAVGDLVKEIDPQCDPHMSVISILSLVLYHMETRPFQMFLSGYKKEHNQVDFIAEHVFKLLMNGLPESK